MINKVKNIVPQQKKQSIGIDVLVHTATSYSFNLVKLSKTRSEVNIEKIIKDQFNVADIKAYIEYNAPVFINIRGKNVLNKIIDVSDNSSERTIISQVLPNAKADDFYFKVTDFPGPKKLVSIIRKSVVCQIIDLFTDNGVFVYDINIGYHNLIETNKIVSINQDFIIGDDKFIQDNGEIINIEKVLGDSEEKIINIEREKISSRCLPAFASAFYCFIAKNGDYSLTREFSHIRQEFKYKVHFKQVGVVALIVFLFILGINYVTFTGLDKSVTKLSNELVSSEILLTRVNELNKNIELQEKLIDESGFNGSISHAFIADRLAYLMPRELSLQSINIKPLKLKLSEDKKCEFRQNIVEITGNSNHSAYLNNWIEEMSKEQWVKDVSIKEYKHNSHSNKGFFIIELKY